MARVAAVVLFGHKSLVGTSDLQYCALCLLTSLFAGLCGDILTQFGVYHLDLLLFISRI